MHLLEMMLVGEVVEAASAVRNAVASDGPEEELHGPMRCLVVAVEAYSKWQETQRQWWTPCASKGLDRPCELAAPGYSNCARCTQDIMYP